MLESLWDIPELKMLENDVQRCDKDSWTCSKSRPKI